MHVRDMHVRSPADTAGTQELELHAAEDEEHTRRAAEREARALAKRSPQQRARDSARESRLRNAACTVMVPGLRPCAERYFCRPLASRSWAEAIAETTVGSPPPPPSHAPAGGAGGVGMAQPPPASLPVPRPRGSVRELV